MKFIRFSHAFLFGINIVLIILAYGGFFEGKDLIPILIAVLSIIFAFIFYVKNNKSKMKYKILGLFIVMLSATGLYYTHFNVFLEQRMRLSEENSIQALNNKKSPTLTFIESINYSNTSSVDSIILNNEFTIVNFWATWCAPCLKEMPILDEFYKKNYEKPIGIIGFTDYNPKDSAQLNKIENLINELNISYPILIDSTTNVRTKYKAGVLPATALIDSKGNVINYQVGIQGAKQIMTQVINELSKQ